MRVCAVLRCGVCSGLVRSKSVDLAEILTLLLTRRVFTCCKRVTGTYIIAPRKSVSRCERRKLKPRAPTPRHEPLHSCYFHFRHSHGVHFRLRGPFLFRTSLCYGVNVKSCVALAPEISTDEGAGSWVAYTLVGVWPEP